MGEVNQVGGGEWSCVHVVWESVKEEEGGGGGVSHESYRAAPSS